MIKFDSFSKLLEMEMNLIEELIRKYSVEVINGDISFNRAIRKLHYDTGVSEYLLEEKVTEEVQSLCPVYSGIKNVMFDVTYFNKWNPNIDYRKNPPYIKLVEDNRVY